MKDEAPSYSKRGPWPCTRSLPRLLPLLNLCFLYIFASRGTAWWGRRCWLRSRRPQLPHWWALPMNKAQSVGHKLIARKEIPLKITKKNHLPIIINHSKSWRYSWVLVWILGSWSQLTPTWRPSEGRSQVPTEGWTCQPGCFDGHDHPSWRNPQKKKQDITIWSSTWTTPSSQRQVATRWNCLWIHFCNLCRSHDVINLVVPPKKNNPSRNSKQKPHHLKGKSSQVHNRAWPGPPRPPPEFLHQKNLAFRKCLESIFKGERVAMMVIVTTLLLLK